MPANPEPLKAEVTPPPTEMVDIMVLQLETALTTIQCPEYVNEAARAFIDAMNKWAKEGK